MFNNPFDSFHNTVAEAKQEREQLDRLLTISTPRERLLVAAIALLLLILTAGLFLGSTARTLWAECVLASRVETLSEGKQSVQALIWVKRNIAPEIKVGMPAAIELGMADGGAETLDGKIATIATVPFSEGLAAFESAVPVSVHRVDIDLDDRLDPNFPEGVECGIVIGLGRQSPASRLRMAQRS